jgi:formylglycine-generating enzyme required for sulfatase activity
MADQAKQSKRTRRGAWLAWWLALVGAVAATGVLGWQQASPPQYCTEGLVLAVEPGSGARRCCGTGQRLERGRCQGQALRCAAGMRTTTRGCVAESHVVPIEGGLLRIAPADWEAASVVVAHEADIAPFGLDSHEVLEADYEACTAAGRCAPLELTGEPGLPVTGATRAEAAELCRWRGGSLPTSAEHAFAAMRAAGRRYPWGDTGAVCRRAAFGLSSGPCATGARGPELAGSRASGATPDGIHDLAGNVAEWTADPDPTGRGLAPVRGGSWQDAAVHALRGWSTQWLHAETRSPAIGWRCAYRSP